MAPDLYVAVGTEILKGNSSISTWASPNLLPKNICMLCVFTPGNSNERTEVNKAIDEYAQLCAKEGVTVEKLMIEHDSIENGIVDAIYENKITRLVMGAAADNRYTKSMTKLESKKAIYVQSHAPVSCDIWFVCKGNLIYTSERGVGVGRMGYESIHDVSFSQWRGKVSIASYLFEEYFRYIYPSRLLARDLAGLYYEEQRQLDDYLSDLILCPINQDDVMHDSHMAVGGYYTYELEVLEHWLDIDN